jgi:hypothetical protein
VLATGVSASLAVGLVGAMAGGAKVDPSAARSLTEASGPNASVTTVAPVETVVVIEVEGPATGAPRSTPGASAPPATTVAPAPAPPPTRPAVTPTTARRNTTSRAS